MIKNKRPIIIFSHGKSTSPDGKKILALSALAKNRGFTTRSLDYRNCSGPTARVEMLYNFISTNRIEDNFILVGSSMGAYVSTVLSARISPKAMFLMCPAFFLKGYEVQQFSPGTKNIHIVHGWNDEVVPYENAVRFAKMNASLLHLVVDDHKLENTIPIISNLFEIFLDGLK